MDAPVLLASASEIRRSLLTNCGVPLRVFAPRVDEEAIKASLLAEDLPPRDIADALAEAKASRVSGQAPSTLVIGADQVLDFDGRLLSKPRSPEDAAAQLAAFSGRRHRLHSAAVICEGGRPVWREVASATLTMRPLSPEFVAAYLDRNWPSIRHSVGGYKIEEEGPRLFADISGSHFAILGLPLLGILSYLSQRGVLDT